jgi:pyridoxine kinase
MIYVCDPVLGDDGKFYVPEEVLDFYKNRLIPISFAITPNYFEA